MNARNVEAKRVFSEGNHKKRYSINEGSIENAIAFSPGNSTHKTRGKHRICICGTPMKRVYIQIQRYKSRTMKAVGWLCFSCKHVELDFNNSGVILQ